MLAMRTIEIDRSGFGFDPQTGDTFTLNPVGALAFGQLATGKTCRDIAGLISDEFDVDVDDAERDLADFIARLTSLGLAEVQQ